MGTQPDLVRPFYVKAKEAEKLAAEFDQYVENLKNILIEETGGREESSDGKKTELVGKDDIEKHADFLINKKKGDELKIKINEIREKLLALLAPEERNEVISDLVAQDYGTQSWESFHFEHSPLAAVVAMMSMIKNDCKVITNDVPDGMGGVESKTFKEAIPKEKLVKIQVMEDWIFDNTHGRMYPRIVALAIVYQPVVAGGSVELPEQPLFWIKYNDARPFFINAEVFNRNMASRISVDHFFQARMFDSQIIKEPNVYDYPIRYYPEYEDNGLAALLKSEEIKNELFVMEHDLWEY